MSLMHSIRDFAEIKLNGIIPWAKYSFPDETHTDVANVSIEGRAGLYRIVVSSSYAVPPLGKVVFKDHAGGHEIEGDNQDGTWHRIAEYLKAAESGEPQLPGDLVEEAIREAIKPVTRFVPVNELPVPPVAFVWYIADPGVWYQNGPALVTRVHPDGSYNLTVFPDGSEPFYREKVGERSDKLRNVCWVPYSKADDVDGNIDFLDGALTGTNQEVAELRTAVTELRAAVDALTHAAGKPKHPARKSA